MQHLRFRKRRQHKSSRVNLDSCIQLVTENITRQRVAFHGIRFYLNRETISQIQQAKANGDRIHISRPLLADLRYYALFDWENNLQSGLTFSTYYQRGKTSQALIRSIMFPDGDAIQQIRSDSLQRPQLALTLTSAHHWLVEQLLRELRPRSSGSWHRLAWVLSALIVAVVALPLLGWLASIHPLWLLLILLIPVAIWLLQVGIRGLLHGLWHQILFGRFSRRRTRKLALRMLGWMEL